MRTLLKEAHFIPRQFTSTEFHSAQDKADFANYFVRFVRSGFNRNLFTKKFYDQLSNCFGHIAHYNLDGFYNAWFSGLQHQYNFLANVVKHIPHGLPAYTFCDVELVLRNWIISSKALHSATEELKAEIERKEREQLDELIKKYGVPDIQ